MSLNSRITKDPTGVYWLEWDTDPNAVAYDIITPAGGHVQAGKKAVRAKLGSGLTEPVHAMIASARPGAYEQANYPPVIPPPPPPPPPSSGIDDYKGICLYRDEDFAKAASLAGIKHARCDWPSAARVQAAKAAGIELLPIADYSRDSGDGHHAPADFNAWADKVVAAALGDWQHPRAVEVWNEPWGSGFWTNPDPVAYYRLVATLAPKLWAALPDCLIVVAADATGSKNVTGTDKWRTPMLAADTAKLLTDPRIRPATHNYCDARPPEAHTSSPDSWDFDRYQGAHRDFLAHGHPTGMVWNTEYGWQAGAGTALIPYTPVTEQQQADYIVRAIKMMQSSGIVERSYAFHFKTNDAWNYNWLRTDNTPKPVCAAVKALA